MGVKLISVTAPCIPEVKTAEEIIVYTARVSNPNNQANMNTAPKLLKYLIEHKHWSPFEMSNLCLEITTSRAIAAQILRHRSFVFQEFSQRYSQVMSYEQYEARRQDIKNKQNSINDLDDLTKARFIKAQEDVWNLSYQYYQQFLAEGVAKESARFLLPLNTCSTLYVSGSVRSWIHYLQVRTDKSTQLEHREIAEECKKIFISQFPNIAEALEWK